MCTADDFPDGGVYDALDQLKHDLISPLTVISSRAQLLARMVQRSSALTEAERGSMLGGLVTIEEAVHSLVTRIDGYGRGDADSRVRDLVIVAADPGDPAP